MVPETMYIKYIERKPTIMTNTTLTTTYQVWGGFDYDELELLGSFDNKADALASAENCYDFNDIVEIVEDHN